MSKNSKDKGVFNEIEQIKLGGFLYDLRFVQEDDEMVAKYAATHTAKTQRISVLSGSKTYGESILHECFHNILWQIKSYEEEENFNGRLSFACYAFIRDNPELIIQMLRENQEEKIDELIKRILARK